MVSLFLGTAQSLALRIVTLQIYRFNSSFSIEAQALRRARFDSLGCGFSHMAGPTGLAPKWVQVHIWRKGNGCLQEARKNPSPISKEINKKRTTFHPPSLSIDRNMLTVLV
jgi:hypothetical protein